MGLNEADKASLLKMLAGKSCLACGSFNLTLGDGFVALMLQSDLPDIVLDAPHVPTAALWCLECGFVSLWKVDMLKRSSLEVKE